MPGSYSTMAACTTTKIAVRNNNNNNNNPLINRSSYSSAGGRMGDSSNYEEIALIGNGKIENLKNLT